MLCVERDKREYEEEEERREEGKDLKEKQGSGGRSEADGLSAEAQNSGRRGEMKDGGTRWNTNWPPLVCLSLFFFHYNLGKLRRDHMRYDIQLYILLHSKV